MDKQVLALCDGADLVLHDAQYTEDEFVELSDWGHSTPAYAVQVANESGARRLTMFHHDPGHNDRELDRMLRGARRIASSTGKVEVDAAMEGVTVEVGRS